MRSLACLFAIVGVGVALAQPKAAQIVVKAGDEVAPGKFVSTLNSPFTNGNGQVGFVGATSDSDRFIWFDNGPIFFASSVAAFSLTGGESTMGIGDNGEFIYSPSVSGGDGVWSNLGLLVRLGDPAPGFPGEEIRFASRPQMADDGTSYWVSGRRPIGGGTQFRVLYKADPVGAIAPVVTVGDVVGGRLVDEIDFDYCPSGDGNHLIQALDLVAPSGVQPHIVVDGAIVAEAGMPAGNGANWQNFDVVSINNNGDYIFTGDTDASSNDEFIAYNGFVELDNNDVVDGIPMTNLDVLGASINNLGYVIYAIGLTGNENLFFAIDHKLDQARLLIRVGDTLDINDDGIADYTISDFNGSNIIGPSLEFAEDGRAFIEVDLTPAAGGADVEAVIGVQAYCNADLDGNGNVDLSDLGILLGCWQQPCGDLDGDGNTALSDLGILLGNWGCKAL